MALYILDTDMLTLLQQGHPEVTSRVLGQPAGTVTTTAITVEEQLSGRLGQLRRSLRPDQLEQAYKRLVETVFALARLPVLTYTQGAISRYGQLRAQKLNVGNNDLRIAAIALENGGVVVTRNLRDFGRIPALVTDDWSLPPAASGTGS